MDKKTLWMPVSLYRCLKLVSNNGKDNYYTIHIFIHSFLFYIDIYYKWDA